MLKDNNLLITGGCGFIGSHLVENFHNKFNKIVIIDNLSTGFIENIQEFLDKYDNIKFYNIDICNIDNLKNIFEKEKITMVSHQAALGSVPRSMKEPELYHLNNVSGFFNILLCCKNFNIKRLVYASSSSVYGDDKILPKQEGNEGNLLSPYAASKRIDEIYANAFYYSYNIETIGLRYFNVFGIRQNPKGAYAAVIPKFINLIKNNQSPKINGDGTFSRDFTYIDNVVQANLLGLTTQNKKAFGSAFNIGCNDNITILELFNILKTELNFKKDPIFKDKREGDIPHSHANLTKSYNYLDYYPKVKFLDGLKDMLSKL